MTPGEEDLLQSLLKLRLALDRARRDHGTIPEVIEEVGRGEQMLEDLLVTYPEIAKEFQERITYHKASVLSE